MPRTIGLINRFDLDPETGCWNWTGPLRKDGYASVSFRGKPTPVHRLAAHLWLKMPIDDKKYVCHHCDNKRCFNPKHLFLGTAKDNSQDSVSKGRHKELLKISCPKGHPYTPENTFIRSGARKGHRECRICIAERCNRYYENLSPNKRKALFARMKKHSRTYYIKHRASKEPYVPRA